MKFKDYLYEDRTLTDNQKSILNMIVNKEVNKLSEIPKEYMIDFVKLVNRGYVISKHSKSIKLTKIGQDIINKT